LFVLPRLLHLFFQHLSVGSVLDLKSPQIAAPENPGHFATSKKTSSNPGQKKKVNQQKWALEVKSFIFFKAPKNEQLP